jgi:PAS domain-containing protein
MTPTPEGGEPPARSATPSLEDDLAFLLLFSDAVVELIPDGVVVLDAALRVRSANAPAAALLGFRDSVSAAGADLSGHALLALRTEDGSGPTLREALAGLGSETLDTGLPEERGPGWRVRASFWDAEHPDYRRTVLWLRRREAARAPARPSLREEQADLLLRVSARSERLLDRVPVGVCVVDPASGWSRPTGGSRRPWAGPSARMPRAIATSSPSFPRSGTTSSGNGWSNATNRPIR